MEIVRIPINEIQAYKGNAKKHPQSQIDKIKESITLFGNCDPIAVWGQDNVIVEGHGRLQALKELGYAEAECIRLDNLTDEERKAYTLIHNKLTMDTDWDLDVLAEELESISDIDMGNFDFEMPDLSDPDIDWKEKTQDKVFDILNLGKRQFDGVGRYDIPPIKPVTEIPEVKEWLPFNYMLSDRDPRGKGIHFFIHDYQFERIWNNPDAYINRLREYEAVLAPDFSPYGDMPLVTQMWNHYRKHWIAAYYQEHGVNIIPTIRASTDPRCKAWFLDGEPKNSVIAFSNMWISTQQEQKKELWDLIVKKIKPKHLIIYGEVLPYMTEYSYEEIGKFTDKWNKI